MRQGPKKRPDVPFMPRSNERREGFQSKSATLGPMHGRCGPTSMLTPTLRRGAESRPASATRKIGPLVFGLFASCFAACVSGLLDPYISHLFLLLLLLLLAHGWLRSLLGSDESRISTLRHGFITFRQVVRLECQSPSFVLQRIQSHMV